MLVRGRNDGSQAAKDVGKVDIKAERVKSLLSMYGEPPSGEIRMEEFEAYSIDRLMGTYRQPAMLRRLAPGGSPAPLAAPYWPPRPPRPASPPPPPPWPPSTCQRPEPNTYC